MHPQLNTELLIAGSGAVMAVAGVVLIAWTCRNVLGLIRYHKNQPRGLEGVVR